MIVKTIVASGIPRGLLSTTGQGGAAVNLADLIAAWKALGTGREGAVGVHLGEGPDPTIYFGG
jgi:hypothetical protein